MGVPIMYIAECAELLAYTLRPWTWIDSLHFSS